MSVERAVVVDRGAGFTPRHPSLSEEDGAIDGCFVRAQVRAAMTHVVYAADPDTAVATRYGSREPSDPLRTRWLDEDHLRWRWAMRRQNLTGLGLMLTMVTTLVSGCGSTSPTTAPEASPTTLGAIPSPTATPSTSAIRDCTQGQLSMKYYGGGVATGNNFGAIVVLNRSATECRWRGGVSVVALNAQRQPFEAGGTRQVVMSATSMGIVLSAHDHLVTTQPAPAGDSWGQINLIGFDRDDPKSPTGSCSPVNEVRPPYWGVATLGEKYTVNNYDHAKGEISRNSFVGLTSCRGRFKILSVAANH